LLGFRTPSLSPIAGLGNADEAAEIAHHSRIVVALANRILSGEGGSTTSRAFPLSCYRRRFFFAGRRRASS